MVEGTLLFVHGTGVRRDGFHRYGLTFRMVPEHTAWALSTSMRLHGETAVARRQEQWGSRCRRTSGLGAPATWALAEELDQTVDLWAMLLEDPLFELRVAGGGDETDPRIVVGGLPPSAVARDKLRGLLHHPVDLEDSGLAPDDLSAAISAVEESEEFAQAAGCLALPELAWPIARAVVAVILAAHRLDEPGLAPAASLDGKVRDAVVTALANALAPPTRTLTGWTLRQTWRFVGPRATQRLADRRCPDEPANRGRSGHPLLPAAWGDYQRPRRRRPEGSTATCGRCRTQPRWRGAGRPAVTTPPAMRRRLGHGGIAGTAVLRDRRAGEPAARRCDRSVLPRVNIYNPHDMLSFCAQSIFEGAADIVDHPVDPGVPFPEAHGAYWRVPEVFSLIRKAFRDAA